MVPHVALRIFHSVYRNILLYFLIILFVLFFFGGPDYYSARYFKAFWNLGHIVFFSLLPYFIFSRLRRWQSNFLIQAMLTFGMCIVFGAIIEFLQYDSLRTPDMGDVFRDVIGGMVGIFFLLPSRKTIQRKLLGVFQVITVCLVGLQVYPFITALCDEYFAREQFPILSSFETPWEVERWSGSADYAIDDCVYLDGEYSMRVLLNTNMYSGVSLKYFPENWEGARSFRFSVYNPSEEILFITCRINDQRHNEGQQLYEDRFNRRYSLPIGWSTIEIDIEDLKTAPKTRRMDLRHIKGVGLFATQLPHPLVIYIDDVRLVY